MGSLTTALVGRNAQCLAPGPVGSAAADQVLIVNLDTANTVKLGSSSVSLALTLGPLASITLTAPVYAAAATEPLQVGIAPGGSSYSPGSLTITGPVTAEITGPVTVEGTVGISGTVNTSITGGTVNANITNANIDATITNSTIDVIGSGGFVLPGQLSLLAKNAAAFSAPAGGSTLLGNGSVSNYSSILFYANSPSNSSAAAGAAVCAMWVFQWTDASGNVITTDTVSCLMGCQFAVQVPAKGSNLNVFLFNNGSTGTITYAANSVVMWGDYRTVPATTVMSYGVSGLPAVTGWNLLTPASPVISVAQWIAAVDQSPEAASTSYLLPLPLWRGMVSGWYQQATQALANNATIVDLTYATQGNIPPGTAYPNGIIESLPSPAATAQTAISYYSPPTQLGFLFKTGATAGGQTELYLTGST